MVSVRVKLFVATVIVLAPIHRIYAIPQNEVVASLFKSSQRSPQHRRNEILPVDRGQTYPLMIDAFIDDSLAPEPTERVTVLPQKAQLPQRLTPVRDQGRRGTCVAFAIAAAMEIVGGIDDLSEQYIYYRNKKIESKWLSFIGLDKRDGLRTTKSVERMRKMSAADEDAWPYNPNLSCQAYHYACSHKKHQGRYIGKWRYRAERGAWKNKHYRIGKTRRSGRSLRRIKENIADGFPVVMAFSVTADFMHPYWGGVVLDNDNKSQGGHAVVAIAYYDDPFIQGGGFITIKNSWGSGWGAAGFAHVSYAYLAKHLHESVAVTSVIE